MLSKQRLVGMTNILGLDFLPLRWYKCRMIHGMEKPLTLSLSPYQRITLGGSLVYPLFFYSPKSLIYKDNKKHLTLPPF